ncbi:PEP-CTERM/exosortase system-associated acyltransferase [Neptunomonas phycophila]|uniref:PEP-CTERM/exosortase system-associated acyltransferase n=1 Tax=Neptunomonas phycophila TaxID=1572645 RepID=UPI003512D362
MTLSLAENFNEYFSVSLAITEEEKLKAYKTRYRVYCEEFEYEEKESFTSEMEKDDFDDISYHCLITHRSSGYTAACVRLVPASKADRKTAQLPLEKYCSKAIGEEAMRLLQGDRTGLCEVSRLAVDATFRRRESEKSARYGNLYALQFGEEEKRLFPIMAVSAFLAIGVIAMNFERNTVFAMMEPFLPRLLKRSGLVFDRVGDDMDYHGVRAPYIITTSSGYAGMKPELKELYDVVYQQLLPSLEKYNKVA